jgi:hypothetical protein
MGHDVGTVTAHEATVMTDEEFAALDATEREFAIRWTRMTDDERAWFRESILAALAVLRALGVIDPPRSEGPVTS